MIRLKNILSFTGLVVGVPQSIAHQLNWMGRAVVPDIVSLDQGGYTVAATSTLLTVTRNAGAPAAVDALVESWHSIERAFGAKQTLVLSPQPIVIQGAGSGGGGSGSSQVFRYTVQMGDTDTIVVPLPAARADANYNVQATMGLNTAAIGVVGLDPASFTVAHFTINLTSAANPGDTIMFTVEELT
jgi:hypothetical protein